jgi:hypothetical protein
MKRGRPKKQHGYLRAAARAFVAGTRCRTPEEAVLKGLRSLEDWADALGAAREAQALRLEERRTALSVPSALPSDARWPS